MVLLDTDYPLRRAMKEPLDIELRATSRDRLARAFAHGADAFHHLPRQSGCGEVDRL